MTLWACFGASPAYFRVGGGTLSHLLSVSMGLFSAPLGIFAVCCVVLLGWGEQESGQLVVHGC